MRNRTLLHNVLGICFGLIIGGLGTAIIYKSSIGSNAMATLSDGLSKVTNLQKGTSNIILNALFLVPCLVYGRDKIGIGTLLMVFTMGLFINFWIMVLRNIPSPNQLPSQILVSFLGTNILALGLAFYIQFKSGLGPLEILAELIKDITKKPYGISRAIMELSLLITGILMGGVFGLGTIISMLLTGILMQYYGQGLNKIFKN